MTEETHDETTKADDGGQPSNEQGYITREDFETYQETINEEISKGFRGVQSKSDEYQAAFKSALETLGGQPPSQEKTETPGQEAASEQTEGEDAGVQAYNQAISAVADGMVKEFGIDVKEDDPEAEIIKKVAEDPDPYKYLEGVRQALTAKKERLAKEDTEVNPARITGLGGDGTPSSNPIQEITDPTELWDRAEKAGKI